MSDDNHDDDGAGVSDKVKKAMGRKTRVKAKAPDLKLVAGGLGDERPEPPPQDDISDDGAGDDFDDEGGDDYDRPEDQTENERVIAAFCAGMDQNDRDNGRRLIAWFGDHLETRPRPIFSFTLMEPSSK